MDSTKVQIIHDGHLEYDQPEFAGLRSIYVATRKNKHKSPTFDEISWAIQIRIRQKKTGPERAGQRFLIAMLRIEDYIVSTLG